MVRYKKNLQCARTEPLVDKKSFFCFFYIIIIIIIITSFYFSLEVETVIIQSES